MQRWLGLVVATLAASAAAIALLATHGGDQPGPPPRQLAPSASMAQVADAPPPGMRSAGGGPASATPDPLRAPQASARFAEVRACIGKAETIQQLGIRQQQCAAVGTDDARHEECRTVDASLRDAQAALAASACTSDPDRLQAELTDATAAAARAGDIDAQLCFIDGGYYPTEPAAIDAYATEARAYMRAALERGDWRIVETLATPPESLAHGGVTISQRIDVGLPFTAYRATKLLAFGADGVYPKLLAIEAKTYARDLSPAQVANADAWAKAAYARHFAGAGRLTAAPPVCLAGH